MRKRDDEKHVSAEPAVQDVEAKAEEKDADKPGEEAHDKTEREEMKTGEPMKRGGMKRARGGRMPEHERKAEEEKKKKDHEKRKGGGHVPGMKPEHRPDRRARGGGLADTNPYTAAGKMSSPGYETKVAFSNGKGSMGNDSKGPNGRD